MRDLKTFLKNKIIDIDKLKKIGFIKNKESYIYKESILNDKFIITIESDGKNMTSKLIDIEQNDEYLMVDIENAVGEFVGKVKNEYESVLKRVIESCTTTNVFTSKKAKLIINYIDNKYGDKLEFLWEKFPEDAIWRNKVNGKWYGLIMRINEKKLGLETDKIVEVINIKFSKNKIDKTIDYISYFPAYHMNKSSWITIKLDGNLPIEDIYELIDKSYNMSVN